MVMTVMIIITIMISTINEILIVMIWTLMTS